MEKITIFGTGNYAKKNWTKVREKYDIVAALDNKVNESETLEFEDGLKIYRPCQYMELKNYPILILVYNYKDIVKQLVSLGVEAKNIWISNLDANSNEIEYVTSEEINRVIASPNKVISEDWGYRRGTPIGRFYINKFLTTYHHIIVGDIMEVGDSSYSMKYSVKSKVKSYTAIHVEGAEGCRKANLETGEGLYSEEFDTMIITQTLAYIYDLKSVVENVYKSLKKGGHCLITVTDIGHMGKNEMEKYGTYWGFHKGGCKKLFADVFGEENVIVETYGNIKTVVAQLYGLAAEDLEKECFDEHDELYPQIIGIVVHKV